MGFLYTTKRFVFKSLGLENYLRLLQGAYFFAYKTGILRYNKTYDCHYFVKKLIKKGDTVIDIGANLGYYSMLFAEWTGPTGKVFSVEPIAVYNKIFNERAKKFENITLYPYALGLEEKKIELVSSPGADVLNTGLPHVYNPSTDGKLDNHTFKFEAQMKIPAVLFRDFDRIDYIKCDIEGFEYTVLANMKEIIGRCRPIVQVEVWPENEKNILKLFEELAYKPCKIYKNELVPQDQNDPLFGDYIFMPLL
jgi:FkbM family methyltransferase